MAKICGKWLKYLRKGSKYVGNDVDMREMDKICREMA